MRLVILIIPRMATSRQQDLIMTGKQTLLTWWQDITPHTTVFPSISKIAFKLKKTNCHNKSLNPETWQHTFHPTTHCQWLSRHHTDKTWTHATISTNLSKQLQVSHLNNDTTPNVINKIQTNQDEHTNLRWQKWEVWIAWRPFPNYAQNATRKVGGDEN